MAINVIGCQEVSYFSSLFRHTNLIISPYDPYLIQISEAMWDLSFFILLTIQMTPRLNHWPHICLWTHSKVKSNGTNKDHNGPLWSNLDRYRLSWSNLNKDIPMRSNLDPDWPNWSKLDPYRPIRSNWDPNRTMWSNLDPNRTIGPMWSN